MNRKRLSLLLALCMMLSLLPIGAQAAGRRTVRETYINPAYAEVIDASELSASSDSGSARAASTVCNSVEEAAANVREQLKSRRETVQVSLRTTDDYSGLAEQIYQHAVAHTGVPNEGDFLRWQIGGWQVTISWSEGSTYNDYAFTYTMRYYTTADQERTLDARVAQALDAMQLSGRSREDTIRTIYNYVRDHVTYDYANLEDDSYKLKYTAYAALINGTSVCQGYSVLLYRLMLEAGIDCRVVTGVAGKNQEGHAWNIVKLGGVYYCMDATWDSGSDTNRYELVGLNSFTDHTRDPEYSEAAFTSVYPTSNTDYVFGSAKTSGDLTYIVKNGNAVITECAQSVAGEIELPAVMDGMTLTGIGFGAFERCAKVTAVYVPETVTEIAERAFHQSCASLADVYYTGSREQWEAIPTAGENDALLRAEKHFNFCRHEMTKTEAVAPTCTASGAPELWTCGLCGLVFLDAKGAQIASSADLTIPALGHDYADTVTAPSCTEQGYTTHTCRRCGYSCTDSFVDAAGHDIRLQNERHATETASGYTGDKVCAVCGELFELRQPTELRNAVDPSCTEVGYSGDEIIIGSDETVQQGEILPALGHAWSDWTVDKPATETAEGVETRTCSVCGATESRSIQKLPHVHKYTDTVTKPTCTKDGYTTHTCSECGYSYNSMWTLPTGHSWGAWKVKTAATETAEGVDTRICSVCGITETRSTPKLTPKPAPPKPSDPKPAENPFADVHQDDYFYDPVLWALNHDPQITDGMTETTFAPDVTCTRGQVVTFLWRSMGCAEPKNTHNPFADVSANDYYYKAVLWAVEKGITDGTSDTTFSPNDPCTRAHVVTFLWRAESKPDAGSDNPFTDVTRGEYYTHAVLWAVSRQITDGTSETTFSPESPCTRGQIVTFLCRDMQ